MTFATLSNRNLTVGGLFSGIGGFELGMQRAGLEIIWMCEIDPFCQKVLKKHWPNVRLYNDVHEINRSNAICPDVLVGGFPCQPYSLAGRRRGAADDRDLWPEYRRIIAELKPTWIIGENVPGIIGVFLDSMLSDLANLNYEASTFIIPACAVDAPHRRNRIFIVAHAHVQQAYQQCSRSGESGRQPGQPLATREEALRQTEWETSNNDATRFHKVLAHANGGNEYGRISDVQMGRFRQQKTIETDSDSRRIEWQSESSIRRVANGIPNRLDRLRSLGNAVVPQIVEVLGQMILEIDLC